ncbi:MAG: DUF309 domain-containing protein [Halanaeroarchaeum sp.]
MDEHTRDDSVDPPPDDRSPTGWDEEADRWEHATLRRAALHGVRLFNEGEYHAAHDCFEDEWFNYGAGTKESAFLHGMVQVAAGAHKHFDYGDDGGTRKLFSTAERYLEGLPADFYGVDVAAVRDLLSRGQDEPTAVREWSIPIDGERPTARAADREFAERLP